VWKGEGVGGHIRFILWRFILFGGVIDVERMSDRVVRMDFEEA
jgi:hypothetical protein